MLELIPTKKTDSKQVRLYLPNQTRTIGKIAQDTFTCTRNERHIFRSTNSIGLNYELLTSKNISFKWILIKLIDSATKKTIRQLVTTRSYFLHFGQYMEFRQQNFEAQVFLCIDEFDINRAREFENNLNLNLFSKVI